MITRDRSFPHPVLAEFRDDVVPSQFGLATTVSPDPDNYYLEVQFVYSSPSLASLIKTGKAIHTVHLECKRNFYREVFSFEAVTERITIPASQLVGRVEVSGFIVAREAIEAYRIDGAHSDYGDATFQIQPGDILAMASTQVFDAYTDYDPLRRISSILTIRRSDDEDEGPMSLDTSGELIVATLSRKDYERYTDLKTDLRLVPLLANQVVLPAILEAVHQMKRLSEEEFEEEKDKRWFRSVVKKLDDDGIDIRDEAVSATIAVQRLLQLPLRRSLEGLNQIDPLDDR